MDTTHQPATFKIGDRVQLGDGPCMAVIDVGRESGLIWCRWIGDQGQLAEGAFTPQSLRPFHRRHPAQARSLDEMMADFG